MILEQASGNAKLRPSGTYISVYIVLVLVMCEEVMKDFKFY